MLDELRLLRAECTEQREAKEAAYAELYKARGFVLADEERRKLTGDALHAERASEHEFNRANALERACAEKDRRIATQAEAIAELTRRRDELESWHGDEKTWRVGAEQERNDAMQRIKALEDDCETAGAVMGAVCVLATLRPGEKYAGPDDHAVVYAVVIPGGDARLPASTALARAVGAVRLTICLDIKQRCKASHKDQLAIQPGENHV